MFGSVYGGTSVLVTGHTGFKGSWLMLWLERLGATVSGYALAPPTAPNHWELLRSPSPSAIADVRDLDALNAHLAEYKPAAVFHLAAQSSVLVSHREPLETLSTNVLGTASVLEACRAAESVKAVVIVTTDKCYENQERAAGYVETDPLGGVDPYSVSKACAELVTAGYRRAVFARDDGGALVATARSGNVIGGGDWTADRIVPDAMRAASAGAALQVRNPGHSRPWQHVLEPLAGYLLLGQLLLEGREDAGEAWNFGPDAEPHLSVIELVRRMSNIWPAARTQVLENKNKPIETHRLVLNSTKARERLNWLPVWSIDETLERTVDWYRTFYETGELRTAAQLDEYMEHGMQRGSVWASH